MKNVDTNVALLKNNNKVILIILFIFQYLTSFIEK